MINGHFFDASIYKADPVPMALDSGVVYEAERTGESQGLFTIKNVLQNEAKHTFLAEGTWIPASAEQPKTATVKAETKPRADDEDQPPVLRRPGSEPAKTEDKPSPTAKAPTPPKPDEDSDRPILHKPQSSQPSPATTAQPPADSSASATIPSPDENDPNRPRLRRDPAAASQEGSKTVSVSKSSSSPGKPASSTATESKPQAEILPAISDAQGPEPRPYTYDMTPKEEQAFRTKVLALASEQLLKHARQLEPELLRRAEESRPIRAGRVPAKPPVQPVWDDVQLRVFDVATNNEPILVLSAKAHLPERPKVSAEEVSSQSAPTEFYVTIVAHSDLYGELKSLFSAVTDDRMLDVTPKYQLIDVVDADGDNRGELLFRRTSDQGTSFAVYRVGADQLWPLYEGTPGQ